MSIGINCSTASEPSLPWPGWASTSAGVWHLSAPTRRGSAGGAAGWRRRIFSGCPVLAWLAIPYLLSFSGSSDKTTPNSPSLSRPWQVKWPAGSAPWFSIGGTGSGCSRSSTGSSPSSSSSPHIFSSRFIAFLLSVRAWTGILRSGSWPSLRESAARSSCSLGMPAPVPWIPWSSIEPSPLKISPGFRPLLAFAPAGIRFCRATSYSSNCLSHE